MHMNTEYETNLEKAMQQATPMGEKIKTNLEEVKNDDEESVNTNTDNAGMLAKSTHQQGMNKAYPKKAAVPGTTTDDAQCRLIHGHSIPRAFFINKALPEVVAIQTGAAIRMSGPTPAVITADAEDKTKRGIQFLHISDKMTRQTGIVAIARRAPVPNAASRKKKEEPNVQETLCQENMRGKTCMHIAHH
jgi:hypothetical protein